MREVVIVSTARTPFGKFGGAFKTLSAAELGGYAIREAVSRAAIQGSDVDECIMGTVIPAGQGQIPGRQAAIKGGLPHSVPCLTINKVCGSALRAVTLGAQIIKAEDADIIVAGGMESMSNAPYLLTGARWGFRMNDAATVDAMIRDGLWCPENDVHMAVLGDSVAAEYGITREQQDGWAYRSQMRWIAAEAQNSFAQERFAVEVKGKKGSITVESDEAPRGDTTIDGLSKLPPLFVKDGAITAGNAPGVNDGGSAVVVMSRDKAESIGAPILATIRGYAQVSAESRFITTVPGLAIQKLINTRGRSLNDFDLIEINEAFAAVPLVSGIGILGMTEQDMDERVNVNGGAIAVGHPIGATGARILMTLIYELQRRGKKHGLAAICSGMAQGDAVWIEIA